MEDMQFQNDVPTALCLPNTFDRNISKPPGLAKKNWDDLKPTIRKLYLDQGQTLKQLAEYLEEHHGFRPTKKQLLYRISGWRFEKNVKKNERRAIIEHLGPELGKAEFEAQKLRGRMLDEAKLNRWMRLEKATVEGSSTESNEVANVPASVVLFEQDFGPANQESEKQAPTQISNYQVQSEFNLQLQELQSTSVLCLNGYSFDWNSVDVIGSPRLTRLIGALTIEDCDVPLLDLTSNSLGADEISGKDLMDLCDRCDSTQENNIISKIQSWSTQPSTSTTIPKIFQNYGEKSHFGLPFELDPFPTSSSQSSVFRQRYFTSGSFKPMVSDSECKTQLQKLKHMQESEIIYLVEAMGARAVDLYHQRCYNTAETWFRRVVRAKRLMKWYKPHQTLWACLQVAKCLALQFRYKEAQQLHQGLHGTIERILGAYHDISVKSRILNGGLLSFLGFRVEAEAVYRQVLQIHLNTVGTRHLDTISALEDLGYNLEMLNRPDEAQSLLETSLQFRLKARKSSMNSSVDDLNTLQAIIFLARALQGNGRYNESEKVLDYARNVLGDVTRRSSRTSLTYHLERAWTYKLQKRFENSEKIFRGLLKYHQNYMEPATKLNSMIGLEYILMETGRYSEATFWYKQEYHLKVDVYGRTHKHTMDCCMYVGFSYVRRRRYNEGKLFFEEAIEMLHLSNEEPISRAACIQDINAWIEILEEMRVQSMDARSGSSDSVDSESEPFHTDDDINYEIMGDIPDPLDY